MATVQQRLGKYASRPRMDWVFTGGLWVLRWCVILPINWLQPHESGGSEISLRGNFVGAFFLLVLIAPLLETLIECSLPYWILSRFSDPVWPPVFIIVSASIMAVLHLVSPIAVYNALVTGAFIAGVFALAARRGQGNGFVHAVVFHGGINLVGWILLLFHGAQ